MKYTERLFPDMSQSMSSTRPTSEGARKKLPFKAPSRVNTTQGVSASTKSAPKPRGRPSKEASVPSQAKTTAKKTSNSFRPASKAAAVPISSSEDEDEDILDEEPVAKKQKRKPAIVSDDDEDEEDSASSEEERPVPKQAKAGAADDEPAIPQKLLTRLLYEGFEDKNMKIGKEAMNVVSKYMETFVREALARAVYEREEAEAELGTGSGDGFLQVEDLEKLAPQLLLDF